MRDSADELQQVRCFASAPTNRDHARCCVAKQLVVLTTTMTDRGFAPLTIDACSPEQRAILEATRAKFGAVPPAAAKLARVPELMHAFEAGLEAFARTSLTQVERELVTLVMARDIGCTVCTRIHTHIVAKLGQPELGGQVADREMTDPKHTALAHFVEAMIATRGDVDDASWAEFLAAGYTREQALEVVIGVGAYTISMYANRLTNAH
jgi:uncharacterized peroxidase-related enzyme